MDSAVNFDNFRAITDGDTALEQELFRLFLDSSQKCFAALRTACDAKDDTTWKKEAHAFKGLCLNLGAEPLGAICKKAQDEYTAPAADKEKILAAMEHEFARVEKVLMETGRGAAGA